MVTARPLRQYSRPIGPSRPIERGKPIVTPEEAKSLSPSDRQKVEVAPEKGTPAYQAVRTTPINYVSGGGGGGGGSSGGSAAVSPSQQPLFDVQLQQEAERQEQARRREAEQRRLEREYEERRLANEKLATEAEKKTIQQQKQLAAAQEAISKSRTKSELLESYKMIPDVQTGIKIPQYKTVQTYQIPSEQQTASGFGDVYGFRPAEEVVTYEKTEEGILKRSEQYYDVQIIKEGKPIPSTKVSERISAGLEPEESDTAFTSFSKGLVAGFGFPVLAGIETGEYVLEKRRSIEATVPKDQQVAAKFAALGGIPIKGSQRIAEGIITAPGEFIKNPAYFIGSVAGSAPLGLVKLPLKVKVPSAITERLPSLTRATFEELPLIGSAGRELAKGVRRFRTKAETLEIIPTKELSGKPTIEPFKRTYGESETLIKKPPAAADQSVLISRSKGLSSEVIDKSLKQKAKEQIRKIPETTKQLPGKARDFSENFLKVEKQNQAAFLKQGEEIAKRTLQDIKSVEKPKQLKTPKPFESMEASRIVSKKKIGRTEISEFYSAGTVERPGLPSTYVKTKGLIFDIGGRRFGFGLQKFRQTRFTKSLKATAGKEYPLEIDFGAQREFYDRYNILLFKQVPSKIKSLPKTKRSPGRPISDLAKFMKDRETGRTLEYRMKQLAREMPEKYGPEAPPGVSQFVPTTSSEAFIQTGGFFSKSLAVGAAGYSKIIADELEFTPTPQSLKFESKPQLRTVSFERSPSKTNRAPLSDISTLIKTGTITRSETKTINKQISDLSNRSRFGQDIILRDIVGTVPKQDISQKQIQRAKLRQPQPLLQRQPFPAIRTFPGTQFPQFILPYKTRTPKPKEEKKYGIKYKEFENIIGRLF